MKDVTPCYVCIIKMIILTLTYILSLSSSSDGKNFICDGGYREAIKTKILFN